MTETRTKVASTTDFASDRESMKQVEAGDTHVLLVHDNGQYRAFSASCPHQGAPLAQGKLHNGCVVCPWHLSKFDAQTGELREPPTLDGLERYEVEVEGDDIYVTLPEAAAGQCPPEMAAAAPREDERLFVIVGGGAAGAVAAETLRQAGYRGRIMLLMDDPGTPGPVAGGGELGVPYDRTNCSKDYLAGTAEAAWMPLRADDFYKRNHIELVHERVTRLDVHTRHLTLGNGYEMRADAILLATGGEPRRLDVPGADLANVFTLRTMVDADAIIAAAEGKGGEGGAKKAVVVGASFIGMEAASSLAERGVAVTVVAPDGVPFERTLGEQVGLILQRIHQTNGTTFQLGRSVRKITGEGGGVAGVSLDDGTQLDADLVLVGIGVSPRTDYLQGVDRLDDGSVRVDDHLRLAEHVYAVGDIATYPEPHLDQAMRIEHWRLAQQHGRCAAHNMAGHATRFTGVPFFWTHHFGTPLDYVGHAGDWDDLFMIGDPEQTDFTAFYLKGNRPVAAFGTQSDQIIAFDALMHEGRLPSAGELREAGGLAL